MMHENLLKSNFLGRDGFRWWVGQVAPIDAQGKQVNGGGWGNRFKVRIMGYHPFSEVELPNADLPWAQCLLPTTAGSGAANMATNVKLQPGDVVFGFFLDGDNAQIPAIMGCFGRTDQVLNAEASSPFVPFTGYTDRIPPPNGTLNPNQANDQNVNAQKSPRSVPPKVAKSLGGNELSFSSLIGQTTIFANTCSGTSTDGIISEVTNLLDKIQNGAKAFLNLNHEINQVVDKIQGIAQGFIGQMFNHLFESLVPVLQKGLDLLYRTVFAKVLAITRLPPVAHLAGVAAQTAMVPPVNILEQSIACVAGNVAQGLRGTVRDILTAVIDNVQNFTTCAGQQFVGSFLNRLVDDIVSGLAGALGGVSKILSGGFNVANTLRSSVDAIKAIGGLFDCNQNGQSKCGSLVRKWTVGKGPNQADSNDFNAILSNMNVAAKIGSLGNDFQQQYGDWDIFGTGTKVRNASSALGGCYTGPPSSCGPVQVRIFGGFGDGATAAAILGSFVRNTPGLNEAVNAVSQTGSILGVRITNPGQNYRYPPFVEFVDNCGQGYGAIGRATINDEGQVTGIYVVSTGENYPITEETPVAAVSDVVIDNAGSNYKSSDKVVDNFGNRYSIKVNANGNIISSSLLNISVPINDIPRIKITSDEGIGAILKPIIGISSTSDQKLAAGISSITSVIDCVSP